MANGRPLLKIHRFLPTATNDMYMKFETPKQTPVMLRKPCHLQSLQMKNSIWTPGGHFENDIAENGQASTHIHKYCATEV